MDWIQSNSNDVVDYEIYQQQDKNKKKLLVEHKHYTNQYNFLF